MGFIDVMAFIGGVFFILIVISVSVSALHEWVSKRDRTRFHNKKVQWMKEKGYAK